MQFHYSLSKSFTATAVDLAVYEGRLSVDDPVLGFSSKKRHATRTLTLQRCV